MPPDPDALITDGAGRTFRRGDWVEAGRIALPRCACLATWTPAVGDRVRRAVPRTWPLDQRRQVGEVVSVEGERCTVAWVAGGPLPQYTRDELAPEHGHAPGCATGETVSR